jgi:DGQHR domain-containing protein
MSITVKGIECTQNGKSFLLTSIKSDILKQVCFVSRKKENQLRGFQRLLNPKRAKDIATYLDNFKGIIPTVLVLSAQSSANISFDTKKQLVSFDVLKDSFLVIDGQHRLYGLVEAKGIYEIPVVIFNSLSISEEVRLFIDINTTQKGVPTSLILDIKNQAGTETKIEERQRILFEKLNSDSVMAGYLLPNESKTGKISRVVFNSSTKEVFVNSPVSDFDDEIIFKTVQNYLEAFDRVFKETGSSDARLNKAVFFKAAFVLFREICERCLTRYKSLRIESLVDYLRPISQIDYSKYTGSNKATESKIISDMRSALKETLFFNEDML